MYYAHFYIRRAGWSAGRNSHCGHNHRTADAAGICGAREVRRLLTYGRNPHALNVVVELTMEVHGPDGLPPRPGH